MEGSGEALDAPLPRMQQDLRFRAARRVDFVHRDSQVGVDDDACSSTDAAVSFSVGVEGE
jgi:hypothetical protein